MRVTRDLPIAPSVTAALVLVGAGCGTTGHPNGLAPSASGSALGAGKAAIALSYLARVSSGNGRVAAALESRGVRNGVVDKGIHSNIVQFGVKLTAKPVVAGNDVTLRLQGRQRLVSNGVFVGTRYSNMTVMLTLTPQRDGWKIAGVDSSESGSIGRPKSESGAAATAGSSATSHVAPVIGATSLSGLPIAGGTSFRRVLRYFNAAGERGSYASTERGCRLSFTTFGLFVEFNSLAAAGPGRPSTCTTFGDAVATSENWHTTNGLRVGAASRVMHQLFPRAFNAGAVSGQHWRVPAGATEWQLTHSSGHAAQPVLIAYVKGGRVVALAVEVVGH